MLNISSRWAFLVPCMLVLIIGCAGSPKPPQLTEAERAERRAKAEANVDDSAKLQYQQAIDAMQNGNIVGAKRILSNLTRSHPDLAGPYVNLGIIHFRADEIDKAEEAFNQALKVNPESAVSLNHLGIIYRGKGKFKEARSNYEKALQVDPNYAYAHLNFGILLDLYLGELDKALEHYQKFQELNNKEDKEVTKWIVELERRIKRANN